MAGEHNVIQQQDRPQKPATCSTTTLQPANRTLQPANRTINLNHTL